MIRSIHLKRDERGMAAVEFAMAAPVLLTIVIGVAQLGLMYSANTGVHHAVEEGARIAATFPTPSPAEIRARVQAAKFMVGTNALVPEVTMGTTAAGDEYVDIGLSHVVPLNFVFFSVPSITVDHSRRVFRQVAVAGETTMSPAAPGAGTSSGGTTTGGTTTGGTTTGGTTTGGTTTGGTTGATTPGKKTTLPPSNGKKR
jgi:Flp pilus assembly protein TadG